MKKLITSALPYVNNVPHLGNIIGCVLSADVYARFCRLRGYETLYVCGTDEYGTATENKAREEGLTPKEICDKYHAIHARIYEQFRISFDAFGRTSHPEQTEIAQEIFKALDEKGLILEETSQRVFCEHDDMFLADRYVEGVCPNCGYEDARGDQCDRCKELLDPEKLINPRCKVCGNPPILKETAHLNLDLETLQPKLESWFEKASNAGNWTRNAVQTTKSWFERGLTPRPITRDLKWGIPVPKPGFENKVFYVWFDAPIGYISITARAFENWKDWWFDPQNTQLYQFMAKDNIPFHTVMFPASLLGTEQNWTTLHHINSTEYLNYEEDKFSKSRNVGVFGTDVEETGIDPDLWRFYLLFNRPERNDTQFVWEEFFTKVNSDFLDNIGNLVNRSLVYLKKNFDGIVRDDRFEEHNTFVANCLSRVAQVAESLEAVKLREALREILLLGNDANRFFQEMAPWEAIKTRPEHAHATVSTLFYTVRSLAILLQPYMPKTSERLHEMLNLSDQKWEDASIYEGLAGHQIGETQILYGKLEMKQAEFFRKRFGGDWVDLGQADIRIGQIQLVENHPDADALYVLKVDLGNGDSRQIVAGLAKRFQPADLAQRKVLLVANLEAAEIRGVESQGMVLVVEQRKKMDLFQLENLTVGQCIDAAKKDLKPLNFEQFSSIQMRVVDGVLTWEGEPVTLDGNPITSSLSNGKVR